MKIFEKFALRLKKSHRNKLKKAMAKLKQGNRSDVSLKSLITPSNFRVRNIKRIKDLILNKNASVKITNNFDNSLLLQLAFLMRKANWRSKELSKLLVILTEAFLFKIRSFILLIFLTRKLLGVIKLFKLTSDLFPCFNLAMAFFNLFR